MNALGSGPRRLRRTSLHEELADEIRALIMDGRLSAGEKVPEKDLCALFGVSRTPLREALKVLAADRLVSLEPNRGAWVTSVTPEDVREVYPVMGALEGLAAELACDRMTDDEARNLRSLHDQMIDAYRAGSRDAFFRFNQAIHEAILDAARNATLTEQYHGLAARVRQARYVARMTDAQWARAVDEHEAMIRCIETRDGPELARILRLHLRHKAETVLAWVNKAGTGGSPETPE